VVCWPAPVLGCSPPPGRSSPLEEPAGGTSKPPASRAVREAPPFDVLNCARWWEGAEPTIGAWLSIRTGAGDAPCQPRWGRFFGCGARRLDELAANLVNVPARGHDPNRARGRRFGAGRAVRPRAQAPGRPARQWRGSPLWRRSTVLASLPLVRAPSSPTLLLQREHRSGLRSDLRNFLVPHTSR